MQPMAAAGSADAAAAPATPPRPRDPSPASAAGEQSRKRQRPIVTEAQRSFEQLKVLRAQQKKVLTDLRKRARVERRRITALNKKASKVSLQELMEIACLKHQMLLDKGELPHVDEAAAASTGPAITPGQAFAAVAAHAAKRKEQPSD